MVQLEAPTSFRFFYWRAAALLFVIESLCLGRLYSEWLDVRSPLRKPLYAPFLFYILSNMMFMFAYFPEHLMNSLHSLSSDDLSVEDSACDVFAVLGWIAGSMLMWAPSCVWLSLRRFLETGRSHFEWRPVLVIAVQAALLVLLRGDEFGSCAGGLYCLFVDEAARGGHGQIQLLINFALSATISLVEFVRVWRIVTALAETAPGDVARAAANLKRLGLTTTAAYLACSFPFMCWLVCTMLGILEDR